MATSSIRTECSAVLSGSAMVALARRSSTLTIPWVLPKDEASITHAQSAVTTPTRDGNNHGFFLSRGTFTEYDVPGAVSTAVLGINDPGDFTGGFDDGSGIFQGYVSLGGTITSFSVPGAILTFAYQLNNIKKLVVGYYIDSSGILHGYYRDKMGRCTSRSILRAPLGQSCLELTIGTRWWADMRTAQARLMDSSLSRHNNFFTFDYPGSTSTSLNGISEQGFICGRYIDASGIAHGFLARVKGTPSGNQAGTLVTPINPSSPVTPLNPSPSAWGDAMPAAELSIGGPAPSPRCASAIQIVRPLECTVNRNRAGSRLLFLAEFLESRIGA